MPATENPRPLPADRRDLATGEWLRSCSVCEQMLPLLPENFYRRSDAHPFEARCQSCRRDRNREVAAARRAGNGVRSASRFERKFGVEIEFVGVGYDAVVRELRARGIACSYLGYTHRSIDAWKIVTDASVSGGYELVSPPLKGANGFAQLKKACEALSAAGARVDRRCGLHVHHDVNELTGAEMGRLFVGWSANQRATDGLVAPSRRNCDWARPLTPVDVERVTALPAAASGIDGLRRFLSYADRYRSLNIACFARYGTVEVRQHQGSIAYGKIAAWVAFGQAFIAAAKAGTVETTTDTVELVAILSRTGLPAEHAATLRLRADHFAGRRATATRTVSA